MQTPPSLLPHDFCSPGRKKTENDTLPNPRKVVSLSQPEFCQKVDVKEAATRVGGERRVAKLRLLQLFTYDSIYFIVSVVSSSACSNQADTLLDYASRREEEEEEEDYNPALFVETLQVKFSVYVTKLTFVYLSFIPVDSPSF